MIPKRYWCFIVDANEQHGGMFDCIGSASTIRDAVILIKGHAIYDSPDTCDCHVWDIYQDQCIMNESHIAIYIIEPFELTNKTKHNDNKESS